jgi:ATP-binding cassette subfamily B protein
MSYLYSMAYPDEPTWKERREALGYIPPFLKMVWQTNRLSTIAMTVLRLVRAWIPVAALWVGKLIIDTVVATYSGKQDLTHLWKLVALEFAIVFTGEVLARLSNLIESLLADRFSNITSLKLMEHAAKLDLYHFEDPAFYDRLERARRQTTGRIGLLAQLLSIGQDLVTLMGLAVALFIYNPWLLLLLVAAVVPSFLGETHFASLQYSLFYRWTPQRRQLDYIRYVGASDETAKELQMFGLARWLMNRFEVLSDKFYQENKKLAIRKSIISTLLSIVGTLGYYGAYLTILLRAVRGEISLGTLTFLAGSFMRARDLVQRLLMAASDIFYQALYLKDLFEFFDVQPSIISKKDAPQVPNPIREGFVFDNVGFQYPGSEEWAVRNLNFHLKPGERIALVGENGAGKTTITKLIARLYDPTEGRILLDGVDLRDYDLGSVRKTIGVLFQDFVRYDLKFDENIGLGEIAEVEKYLDLSRNGDENGPVPESIRTAAEKSLASSLLAKFKEGYAQMLGRRFDGGVDLSGGEWQKVALGRAYMRNAQVLILDEPTAALDARAEYEVFRRFSELLHGKMAIIISHRFSTVRVADRILVLTMGHVVESGTHEQLLAANGLYADLFALQAEGYR